MYCYVFTCIHCVVAATVMYNTVALPGEQLNYVGHAVQLDLGNSAGSDLRV